MALPAAVWALCVGSLVLPPCSAFFPNFWARILTLAWSSYTHQDITEEAILNVTREILMSRPNRWGRTLPEQEPQEPLTAGDLFGSYYGDQEAVSMKAFWQAVSEVVRANAHMDFRSEMQSNPVYHFDSERIQGARDLLRWRWIQTLDSIRARDYQGAREGLGYLLHSLQDFYSHSNWVEMGHTEVNSDLLNSADQLEPVAAEDVQTCRECWNFSCKNNILEDVNSKKLLTTGYFGTDPKKPPGKCSHGGILDQSRSLSARGGINKDSTSPLFSPHHYLHGDAARLATAATVALLRDLRDTAGVTDFLRLMNVGRNSALVFVIDTTGSMFEEITAARLRALSIIQERQGTLDEPTTYVLVPFHDPAVGPLQETEDPDVFMRFLEDLTALGGGDEPEMCLTALQMALIHSPPQSEIYVFTDASPKDRHLQSAVEGLTVEKRIKVTFLLTEDTSRAGWRRRRRREVLSPDRFSIYRSLSALSGGLTVFTTDRDIQQVSSIVQDSTLPAKVTLFHVQTGPSSVSPHSFHVDSSVKNVTVHIAGSLKAFVLHSPSGQEQSFLEKNGHLAQMETFEGLTRIRLLPPVSPGQWIIRAETQENITLNVIGQSSVDFLYHFAVAVNSTHPGLSRVEGSPVAGVPTFLVLTVTGLSASHKVSFSHVTLLSARGESLLGAQLSSSSSSPGEFVSQLPALPTVPFSVRLTGTDGQGNVLERASGEMVQATHVQLQVLSLPQLAPGTTSTVWFDIYNRGPARTFVLTAADDRGFLKHKGRERLSVAQDGTVRSWVDLDTPGGAQVGSAATLSLSVESEDKRDANFAVLHLSVVNTDPDLEPPSCSPLQVRGSCPALPSACANASWSASLLLSDRGRSGLGRVQLGRGRGRLVLRGASGAQEEHLQEGQGPLLLGNSSAWAAVQAAYTSSCCSTEAELLLWDRAGNLQRCSVSTPHLQVARAFLHAAAWPTVFALSCFGVLLH
ncbi:von Willebrand factor A domain-containing protein 7 isoform X1 [Lepisosteus oculatus]|uniref:von Willebrand factor A domain-containing protein 7 isoform X1 n=2 Tax=Lepisosteus oculatus TaxID=7918 RepID=UPI00371E890A